MFIFLFFIISLYHCISSPAPDPDGFFQPSCCFIWFKVYDTSLIPPYDPVDDLMELAKFTLTTTYFTSKGNIYQQVKGAAMGSPLSPIAVDLYMEWLEGQAIPTAPLNCTPKLWTRYVDDILEIIKKGETDKLTAHLNQIDPTGSIKFTHEEEKEGSIPFLDTIIIRKPGGSTKLSIYRKLEPTHTNQYLQFDSHHPLHQQLGVVRTLLDRKDAIVTEEEDK